MPLDTKVRWKGVWMISILVNLLFVNNAIASGPKCNKIPPTQVAEKAFSQVSNLLLAGCSPNKG